MRILLTALVCIVLSISLNSQDQTHKTKPVQLTNSEKMALDGHERCSTTEGFLERLNDPVYEAYVKDMRAKIDARTALLPCDASNSVIIPVAVHFDASFTCENTTCLEAAVAAQIQTLNDDFAALNADLAAYQNILATCMGGPDVASTGSCLSFCLATENHPAASGIPAGEPAITIGYSTGGLNNGGNAAPDWPGYLNLFVVAGNMSGVADGIPGALDGDGVTCTADVFGGAGFVACTSGNTVNSSPDWNLGRTMTHEVGHYLGLYHVWGDVNGGGCGGDDMITDTPDQATSSSGCTANCATLAACNAGEFVQYNFMDYFDDACLVMFSEEQASVMNTFANAVTWASGTGCSDGSEVIVAECVVVIDCMDGIQNGNETGVDCGGPDCPPCMVIPACDGSLTTVLDENFDACVMPAGWSVVALNGGATADVTFNNMSVPGGGATAPTDFMGCIALIDDDAAGSADPADIRCIVSPVLDLSALTNGALTFDWHNESVVDDGDFIVEVFDGTAWVQVFFTEGDGSNNDETIDLSGYSNADFQIRFCYDDEGGWQWGVGFDNVSVCGEQGVATCPAAITPDDISGSYCDGAAATVSASPTSNVTFAWTSSNPNIVIVDPAAASSSVELSALTPCQIEMADISLVATCDLDGSELFNGIVSTVSVYPAPPADVTTLVVLNENTCDEPVLVDPNCTAFVTLTPDAGNPTFPVATGESGTASYTITYASPAGAPECCVVPMSGELIIGGAGAVGNDDGDLEIIGTGGVSGWTSTSTNFGSVMCDTGSCGTGGGSVNYGVAPNSNAWLAWFGGIGSPETGTLETDVVISACANGAATMTFGYENSSCGDAADFIELQIDGAVVWSDNADPATCGTMGVVELITVDLSAFADGASHNILFTSTSGAGGVASNFTVDNVILETTGCDAGGSLCEGTVSGSYDCVAIPDASIPTMGEWGLMILGLLIMITSIVAIRQKENDIVVS